MTEAEPSKQPLELSDYFGVLRRRKLVVIGATVIVALGAAVLSMNRPNVYRASASVLISRQNLGDAFTNTTNPDLYVDSTRLLDTQAAIARAPEVTTLAIKRSGVSGITDGQLLADSSVTAKTNADVLGFSVDSRDPIIAAKLADAYASAFTVYRQQLDSLAITKALRQVNAKIASLQAQRGQRSDLYKSLLTSAQTLRTMQILQPHNVVVTTAKRGTKVSPTPRRDGIIGGLLGLVIGLGIAFAWEALDKRVRADDEIESRLGLPLLARLPAPPRQIRQRNELTMLREPDDVHAEAIRRLRVNLEFANLDHGAKTILITSAVQQEGKSTTIADLAVSFARAGKTVALVDLDLRRPAIGAFFGLGNPVGLTDVVLGHVQLWQAMVRVPTTAPSANGSSASVRGGPTGTLRVLPAGSAPPNPGEFVATDALARVIGQLRVEYDIVLIDAPPICMVGDAATLSARVDGIVAVARVGVVDRPTITDLARELDATPTSKLGFILTGIDRKDGYGYGGYSKYAPRPSQERAAPAALARPGSWRRPTETR